jgi:hypothetical protein
MEPWGAMLILALGVIFYIQSARLLAMLFTNRWHG